MTGVSHNLRDVHRGGVPVGERRSIVARPLVWLIRLYQMTISPVLGPVCRYYPSCSAYGATALERHGLFRGTWLTVSRVLRCNPWTRGGVDHVPVRAADVTPSHNTDIHVAGEHPELPTTSVSTPHRQD